MIRRCSVCMNILGLKEPFEDESFTDTVCLFCIENTEQYRSLFSDEEIEKMVEKMREKEEKQ